MDIYLETENLKKYLRHKGSSLRISFYNRYAPEAAYGKKAKNVNIFARLRSLAPVRMSLNYIEGWKTGLNYAGRAGQTVVCWSKIIDVSQIRQAAMNLDRYFKELDLCPALVTAAGDFTFFARLGWLVEYIPDMPHADQKISYLALRYRDALNLPLEAGLAGEESLKEFFESSKYQRLSS